MSNKWEEIKDDILKALAHPEAEEGLYLNNIQVVHEVEERPQVRGSLEEIEKALSQLVEEGKVTSLGEGANTIFKLTT